MTVRYHLICPSCRFIAFTFLRRPRRGEVVSFDNIEHTGNPKAGDEIRCQDCGAPIMEHDLVDANLKTEVDVD